KLMHHFWAPDGESVAVDWVVGPRKEEKLDQHNIQVVELPSGRERHRFAVPHNMEIKSWDGRRLETIGTGYAESRNEYVFHSTFYFDLAEDPVGDGVEDPLLCGNWDEVETTWWKEGPGWVAFFHEVRPSDLSANFRVLRNLLGAKVGMSSDPVG